MKCKNCEFVSTFVKVFQDCFIVLHSSATVVNTTTSNVLSGMLDVTLQKCKTVFFFLPFEGGLLN